MAKINLLTIHYGKCYGAVMQTYATCKLLEKAGHQVTVINLIHPRIKGLYRNWRNWKDLVREFQFFLFKKHFFSTMTEKMFSVDASKIPIADMTIVGSDQVWNRDITGDFGFSFYLDFVPNTQKRVALCSSFGKSDWCEDEQYTEAVSKELNKFFSISVREQTGTDILRKVFNLKSQHLQDPTICLGDFKELVYKRKCRKQYIYTFLLNRNASVLEKVDFMAKRLSVPLLNLNRLESMFKCGPRDWLTYIYNAEYVITDSFHGLALSILFHKQFFVFCADPQKFTRLESLLSLLGLKERFVSSIEDFEERFSELLLPIDYSKIDPILKKEREKAAFFISKLL